MYYQINSVPYFQETLMKSKQNGELQTLKEEYQNMKGFNERKLEMRMREVRLTRLKREIEEIMKCDSRKRRLDLKQIPKSEEAKRIENLKQARDLGKFFSKCNLTNAERVPGKKCKPQLLQRGIKKLESIASNRIKYGSEISKCNFENASKKKRRVYTKSSKLNKVMEASSTKSNICKIPSDRIDLQLHRSSNAKSSILTLSENVHFIELKAIESVRFENVKEAHNDMDIQLTNIQSQTHRPNEACDETGPQAPILNMSNSQSLKHTISKRNEQQNTEVTGLKNETLYTKHSFQTRTEKPISLLNAFPNPPLKPLVDIDKSPTTVVKEEEDNFKVKELRRIFE